MTGVTAAPGPSHGSREFSWNWSAQLQFQGNPREPRGSPGAGVALAIEAAAFGELARGLAAPERGSRQFGLRSPGANRGVWPVMVSTFRLRRGDVLHLAQGRRTLRYMVSQVSTVGADDARLLNAAYPRPALALVSCTPPGLDTRRIIVLATLQGS